MDKYSLLPAGQRLEGLAVKIKYQASQETCLNKRRQIDKRKLKIIRQVPLKTTKIK